MQKNSRYHLVVKFPCESGTRFCLPSDPFTDPRKVGLKDRVPEIQLQDFSSVTTYQNLNRWILLIVQEPSFIPGFAAGVLKLDRQEPVAAPPEMNHFRNIER